MVRNLDNVGAYVFSSLQDAPPTPAIRIPWHKHAKTPHRQHKNDRRMIGILV